VRPKHFYLEIFLASFAGLLLEISYTRVFSFKVSSYYTFLIIGLALLGIGAGGVFVALWGRLREAPLDRLLPLVSAAGGAAIGLGYVAVATVELSTYAPAWTLPQVARLALVCTVLFLSFLPIGLVIALIFARRPEAIHRLYFADLVGAGAGCAAAVPMMLLLSPPGCVFASGTAVAALGIRHALAGAGRLAFVGSALSALLALGAFLSTALPDPIVDPVKTLNSKKMERWGFTSVFRRWHPVFRVDVLESPAIPQRKALVHDADWGSALHEFDGNLASLRDRYEASSRALPFAVTAPSPRVLIVGSAGGGDVLASLYFGAERVTAVELNPVTVSLLRRDFADYTGRLAEHPRVELVNAEGRSFLARDSSKYDLIYFVAPDSYATMNAAQASGFVLVESYLYTTEMVHEVLRHLKPGGILCMQFGEVDYERKPNRTARFLATARAVFEELGIGDFARHVLLATNRDFPIELSTMLLRKEAFTAAQVNAFVEVGERIRDGELRYVPGRQFDRSLPNLVISAPTGDLERLYRNYSYHIGPVSDDAPFFWHFARFGDMLGGRNPALRNPLGPEDGRGEAALLTMLLVSSVLSALFVLSPFALVRERWVLLPAKAPAALYFAALGLGFMFFEIALIQKLTLLLGYPTYTLTVTLFALLVFSGLGSLVAERYVDRRDRALLALALVLVGLTGFFQYGIDPIVDGLVGHALPVRIVFAVLVLAPLGLCLGAFMPLGLITVSRLSVHRGEYVAWGWALNGVFSVIGSILATILSMSYGFRTVLLIAAVVYVLAAGVLRRIPLVRPAPQPGSWGGGSEVRG